MEQVIAELEIERDRKECVKSDLIASGANRELAQWLRNHPAYSAVVVAEWLACSTNRIKVLRRWAESGFVEDMHPTTYRKRVKEKYQRAAKIVDSQNRQFQEIAKPLESLDEIADAATIEDNVLYSIQRMNEHARVFKNLFRASVFDREAKERINTAIERMIQKWRFTQLTLTKGAD